MTLISLQDGKPVMRDGKIGTEQACCCGGPKYCCSCSGLVEAIDLVFPAYDDTDEQSAIDALADSTQRCDALRQACLSAGYCSVVQCPGSVEQNDGRWLVTPPVLSLGYCGQLVAPNLIDEFYTTGTPDNNLATSGIAGELVCGPCDGCEAATPGPRSNGCYVYRDDCCKAGPHPSCADMPPNSEEWYCANGNEFI